MAGWRRGGGKRRTHSQDYTKIASRLTMKKRGGEKYMGTGDRWGDRGERKNRIRNKTVLIDCDAVKRACDAPGAASFKDGRSCFPGPLRPLVPLQFNPLTVLTM
jgi:hypothetical protein